MPGQPKITAKRIRQLLAELEEWGNRFTARMPKVYCDPHRPVYGASCILWQTAANALADHYAAIHELAAHLNEKAGYVAPKDRIPDPDVAPEEVTADPALRADADDTTLNGTYG